MEASDAPYFVDLVKDQLSNQFSETDLNQQALRIYTTIDPDLQRAASEAVDEGMKLVDAQVHQDAHPEDQGRNRQGCEDRDHGANGPMPQVALIASIPTPARCWRWSAAVTMA